MNNLKDTLSTYAGIAVAIGLAIIGLPAQGVVVPNWLLTVGILLSAIGGAVIGVLQGRNADGSKKTTEQIAKQK